MAKAKKFGAMSGVFTPSILTILGVIMYLRLPWIVGQAGLWATIGIIMVAHIISLATGMSVASIATDKKVETGGSYYIISRSLGLPIGGTLGLALFVGLSFSISLYLIGFAEVFLAFFNFEVTIQNIRIAGIGALVFLSTLTFISTSLAIKSQYLILTALVLSLLSVFIGSKDHTLTQPLFQSMEGSLPWIALFAIFFPAVTGFEAGVSMSGDLKDPRKEIPLGTIAAVITGLLVYVGLAFFFSYFVDRDQLVGNPSVLLDISWIPQLVVAGVLGATFSSALGSILGAPRILQATANDKITPGVFGKGYGPSNEPRNALLFTFFIALSGILIADLNVIARIVTIFFIITYGFLNITYAVESWAGSDFRPTFRIPAVISIIGALACIIVMIQLDVVAMIAASLVLIVLFLFLKKQELTLQTGDTWNSIWASVVKTGLSKLTAGNVRPRNWRPNVILFSGGAKNRPHLIELGKALVGKLGIFTNFELIEDQEERQLFSKNQQIIEEERSNTKGVFTRRHTCRDIYEGIESIAKIYGFSGFEPNTILMGWPKNTPNKEAFIKSAKTLQKLDYNLVFLNYDKTFEFGNRKNIDIWWSGKGKNLNYALTLIRFISSSEQWRTAKIRILAISQQSKLTENYYDLIQQVLENNRIQAQIKVINNSVEQLSDEQIMRSESLQTDLSIIEIPELNDNYFQIVQKRLQSLQTTIILRSSGQFEELKLLHAKQDERIPTAKKTEEPDFLIATHIKPSERELISNEINNLALKLEGQTQQLHNKTFGLFTEHNIQVYEQLIKLTEKTSDALYQTYQTDQVEGIEKTILSLLNDFLHRAHKILQTLKNQYIDVEKEQLDISLEKHFVSLQENIDALPKHIRLRYAKEVFRQLKTDSFVTALFKYWKLFSAKISGKDPVYKVKAKRATQYYLMHKRISSINQLMDQHYHQSFSYITEIKIILQDMMEVIQKAKSGSHETQKIKNIILMEKDRFKASLKVLKENQHDFYQTLSAKLFSEVRDDLQNLSNILDRPGANFRTKAFVKACKNDKEFLEDTLNIKDVWHHNISLLGSKNQMDFQTLHLKNRIEAKTKKYHTELKVLANSNFHIPLIELKKKIEVLLQNGSILEKKADRSKFKELKIEELYTGLYNEITLLFQDIEAQHSISGDDLPSALEKNIITEANAILINYRKTLEFSVGTEFIDKTKKQTIDAALAFMDLHRDISDTIRLINFNFYEENTENSANLDQNQQKEAKEFIQKIEHIEKRASILLHDLIASFDVYLKNAFTPLSSAIIAKTSGTVQQKIRAGKTQKINEALMQQRNKFQNFISEQFVKVVYSKSESILWMGKLEQKNKMHLNFNEEVYDFMDHYSPKPQTLQNLSFYYSKLFSGQSGIGEDFWVGMQSEIRSVETAIKRHKAGHPGCLIITGDRNSGKTSLCKYVARLHYENANIFNIRAPKEANADVEVFEQTIIKSLNINTNKLELALSFIQKPTVFIINDLELWWQRRENGSKVVEFLISLIKKHFTNALFIVNVNQYSLHLINKLTKIQSWALAHAQCTGFDAKSIKDLIMLRHKAGGMKFALNKIDETQMREWEYARLFNRYFDITGGNPGFAMSLWLSSIKKISGNTLYLEKPQIPDTGFLEHLSNEQSLYLIQFVYHLRLSASSLAGLIKADENQVKNQILNLWQSGILVEKFPGIYSIHASLHPFIVDRFKQKTLL